MGTSLTLVDQETEFVIRPADPTFGLPVICREYDLGTPDVREATQDLTGYDGQQDDTRFIGARTFSCSLMIRDGLGWSKWQRLEALQKMLIPSKRLILKVRRDHWLQERSATCRPAPWSGSFNPTSAKYLEGSVSLRIPSGVFESTEEYEYVIVAPTVSGGMSFTETLPMDFGNSGSGSATLVPVLGNVPAPTKVIFYGDQTNPSISFPLTGETFRLTGLTIPSGSYVVVDTAAGTVLMNGSATVYNYVDWDVSTWPMLQPDTTNQITTTADALGASYATYVRFKDRYL